MTREREQAIDNIYKIKEVTMPGFSSFDPKLQSVGDVKAFNDSLDMAIEALKQEPCGDAISRQTALSMQYRIDDSATLSARNVINVDDIEDLPPVTLQRPRKGQWLRMSDLSEQEDYRYKCSRCGNVINHKDKMDLYTFNSWCGRCGSDNREVEE